MHPREEIAHDLPEIREDLAFERETLDASIRHDYSTSDTGIVPLGRRRPMWHFMGLWTTFVAGFSYMFLGFEIHDGGHSLASTVGILWCISLVLKVFFADGGKLGGTPQGSGLPLWVAVSAVIGFSMWGNEPDFWRYGKPRFAWPVPTYLFAALWFVLFTMAGWMMADL